MVLSLYGFAPLIQPHYRHPQKYLIKIKHGEETKEGGEMTLRGRGSGRGRGEAANT